MTVNVMSMNLSRIKRESFTQTGDVMVATRPRFLTVTTMTVVGHCDTPPGYTMDLTRGLRGQQAIQRLLNKCVFGFVFRIDLKQFVSRNDETITSIIHHECLNHFRPHVGVGDVELTQEICIEMIYTSHRQLMSRFFFLSRFRLMETLNIPSSLRGRTRDTKGPLSLAFITSVSDSVSGSHISV